MIWRLAPLAGILLVAGCAWVDETGFNPGMSPPNAGPALLQLEIISLVNTHKTMGDHVMSWMSGRDCSTPRMERDGTYCTDRPGRPAPPQQVYCYGSLARPSCYAQPYNEGNDRLIGFVPASAPVR